MSIRTSLSLLQFRRDEKELRSDETERPIQSVTHTVDFKVFKQRTAILHNWLARDLFSD